MADGRLVEARGLQVDESILTGESDPDARRVGDDGAVRLVLRRRKRHLRGRESRCRRLCQRAHGRRARGSPRAVSAAGLDQPPAPPAGRAHDSDRRPCCCTPCTSTTCRRARRSRRPSPGSSRSSPRASCCSRASSSPWRRRASGGGARSCSACRPSRRSPGSTSSASTRPARSPTARSPSRRSCRSPAPTSHEVHELLGAVRREPRQPQPDRGCAARASSAGAPQAVSLEVPFSSRWKWSGIALRRRRPSSYWEPPRSSSHGEHRSRPSRDESPCGRTAVCASCCSPARTAWPSPRATTSPALPALAPLALVALSERMRPDAASTVAYLHRTGVHVKVISGDGPATVAAVARAAGIDTDGRVTTGSELPEDAGRPAPQRDRQRGLRPRAARAQAPARRGAASRRPARRDDRRRRQRRPGPQGVRRRGRARLGQPDRQGRGRRRARDRELRVDPLRRRGGSQDPAQRPARRQAVRREVRLRRDAHPDRRRRRRHLPVPPAPALAGRGLDRRHPGVLPGARPRSAGASPSRSCATWPRFALPGRARARLRGPARARARAHLDRPLRGRVADDVARRSSSSSASTSCSCSSRAACAARACAARSFPRSWAASPSAYLVILSFPCAADSFALAAPTALPLVVSIICTTFAIGALGLLGLSLTRPGGEQVQVVRFWRRRAGAG